MKRVSFALIIVLLSFGLSYGVTLTAKLSGPGAYGTAPLDTINTNSAFTIEFEATWVAADTIRLAWSSPFCFYSSDGGITTLTSAGVFVPDASFDAIWDQSIFNPVWPFDPFLSCLESWDGDLSTNAGGKTGDQFNYTGINGLAPPKPPSSGTTHLFDINFAGITSAVTTFEGMFCVDSGNFVSATYDWLFEAPSPGFVAQCWPVQKQPDPPPSFDNCPTTTIVGQYSSSFSVDLDATDPPPTTAGGIHFAMVSGPGDVDAVSGLWTWQPDCNDVGSHTVIVCAGDANNQCVQGGGRCSFTVQVNNTAPVISGQDCGNSNNPIIVGTTASKTSQFSATDVNGGLLTWSVTAIPTVPDPAASYYIDQNGLFTFAPTLADDGNTYCFTIRVTDCNGDYDECVVCFLVLGQLKFDIVIQKIHGAHLGHHSYVNVTKEQGTEEMWGFDFLIGYDQSALTFLSAAKGAGIADWEYFTYRYNWNGNCGGGCPSGLLRVVAIADENNGQQIPPDAVDVVDGTVLFTLDFLVSSNYNLGGQYVMINWYWMDCDDNTIAFHYKSATDPLEIRTAMSKVPTGGIWWYNGWDPLFPWFDVTDPFWGFPTWFGAQWHCFCDPPDYDSIKCPVPFIDFYCGGIDIIPPEDYDDRGDINLNGIANEIADAVVFTNYFIYGPAAFTINPLGQTAATEINGDGIALTVADLVYLIRIIVGDALALPPLKPVPTTLHVTSGEVTVDAAVGALRAVFDGNVEVTLAEGANGMDLQTNFRDGQTHAILYSYEKGITANGHILSSPGQLVSVEAATYEGASFKGITIRPTEFAVKSYPNPFNPVATVEMSLPVASDWTITVFNVVGQRVADFNGYSDAGVVKVQWDASNEASGIYFYKVDAGQYSVTKKMVLLK